MHKQNINAEIIKVDESLGIVFGWAIVCKVDGEEYYDLQGDHIPEETMLKASCDFMQNSRMAKDMHGDEAEDVLPGGVVFAFPLTEDVAKSFGITTSKSGLMIGFKPDRQDILEKFMTGEYTGFSIGGSYNEDNVQVIE